MLRHFKKCYDSFFVDTVLTCTARVITAIANDKTPTANDIISIHTSPPLFHTQPTQKEEHSIHKISSNYKDHYFIILLK